MLRVVSGLVKMLLSLGWQKLNIVSGVSWIRGCHRAFLVSCTIAGYAGYVPAKLPPGRPSAIQEALWQIKNAATLQLIAKLLRNVVVNPTDEKVRRIRLSNPKIESLVKDEKGALQTLTAMGWIPDPTDSDYLVFPKGAQISMSEVSLQVMFDQFISEALQESRTDNSCFRVSEMSFAFQYAIKVFGSSALYIRTVGVVSPSHSLGAWYLDVLSQTDYINPQKLFIAIIFLFISIAK